MPGEAGAPMDMAGAPPVGDGMDERPLKPKGYRGKMVFCMLTNPAVIPADLIVGSLGPTTHSFLCWSLLGTATFLLGIAVLGTPQIKPIAFATGQIPGTQSKMYIGWLGSCIGDEDTKWSTCTPPSFPLSISNFGQLEGRLAEVGKIFDKNSIKALAFNAAAAFFTLVAALMHRIGRNHGPFYLTLFAFVLTLVAFIVDVSCNRLIMIVLTRLLLGYDILSITEATRGERRSRSQSRSGLLRSRGLAALSVLGVFRQLFAMCQSSAKLANTRPSS